MIGVKAIVTMERTLYLDLPDNTSKDDIIKEAQKEIVLPVNALYTANNILSRINVNAPKLDLSDWDTKSVNYEIL